MMKKHIAFMISCIMFAVCFCFPGYALEYYAYTDNTSFDYGDVSLAAKLTGVVSNNSGSNDEYGWDFDYTFTVTLTNKTAEFQVADSNSFMFLFDSGYSDYFTKAQFADTFQVLESSDNTSNIRWEGYGSALRFSFSDSEILVLNPNETRSYSFVIRQHFPFNVNIAWYSNSINASSLTYNTASSIIINTKPSSFTSNTVEDFLNNDSFPNSIIPWLMASYDQGVVDQTLYNSILDAIMHKLNISNFANNQYTSIYDSAFNIMTDPSNIDLRVIAPRPHLYISDFEVNDQSGNSGSLNLFCQPIYFIVRSINNTDNTYQLSSNRFSFNYSVTNSNNNLIYFSYDFELIASENILATDVSFNNVNIQFTNKYNNTAIIPSADNSYMLLKVNYYYISGNYDSSFDPVNTGVPSISITNLPNLTATLFSEKWYFSIYKNFADIRDRLQQLIDGDTSKNDQISDESGTVSDTQDQIHAQEQQWYSDNEAAIEATGLSNFEFSSGELDGLTQLRLQFSQVWGALGDWSLVYIFVLSLSLATFILRHRPTTKTQQRMADSARYRQEVRNRWAAQDARASNNSNGFSDEIWRRAGYR